MMSNSRRWRKFITWWYDMHPQFYAQIGNRHLMACIDHAIDEIKKGERFCVRCGLTEKDVRRDPTNGCWVMGGWYKQHSYVTQRELDKLALMNDNKKDLVLTEQEKKDGWYISYCKGNGYKKGCKLPYKKKSWHTPSGCPNCNATFVD